MGETQSLQTVSTKLQRIAEAAHVMRRRVCDGVLLRTIGKWLNAGVMENGSLTRPESGTPQGGVISPLLANVYLHEVIDVWFHSQVLRRLRGRARLVRYADDMVMVFGREDDARRVFDVLAKRFGKYGLTLHPDKTKLVDFRRPDRGSPVGPEKFDFLGFTHHWGKSLRGNWVVRQRTEKGRLSRALHQIRQWCRANRHEPLRVQQQGLTQKLRGLYGYFGITSNFRAIANFYHETQRAWGKWQSRRSHKGYVDWKRMNELLKRFPLPLPRIMHSYVT